MNPTLFTLANFLLIALGAQLAKVYPHFYILQLLILLALALWLGSRPGGFWGYGVAFVLGIVLDALLWFFGKDFLLLDDPNGVHDWAGTSWWLSACIRVLGPLLILMFVQLCYTSRKRLNSGKLFQF